MGYRPIGPNSRSILPLSIVGGRRRSKRFSSRRRVALQWIILTCVVAAEAAVALSLTLPSPKLLKNSIVSLVSLILQPTFFVVPFAGFQLLDIYSKNEHRLMGTSEVCTAAEIDRFEKSIYKAQRNVVLRASACLLYWCIYCICKYYKEIQKLEEIRKEVQGTVNLAPGGRFLTKKVEPSFP